MGDTASVSEHHESPTVTIVPLHRSHALVAEQQLFQWLKRFKLLMEVYHGLVWQLTCTLTVCLLAWLAFPDVQGQCANGIVPALSSIVPVSTLAMLRGFAEFRPHTTNFAHLTVACLLINTGITVCTGFCGERRVIGLSFALVMVFFVLCSGLTYLAGNNPTRWKVIGIGYGWSVIVFYLLLYFSPVLWVSKIYSGLYVLVVTAASAVLIYETLDLIYQRGTLSKNSVCVSVVLYTIVMSLLNMSVAIFSGHVWVQQYAEKHGGRIDGVSLLSLL
ncbi:membrane protein US18 [Human betaherpesvirus 5]|uniref:Membrane protein US18 n=1 Tax=Human cytomegalovirus TaxID=10359 RepID=A0A0G2U0N5_HCMV|nr:membrane protein US18 [Human betaherpesvirus 5]